MGVGGHGPLGASGSSGVITGDKRDGVEWVGPVLLLGTVPTFGLNRNRLEWCLLSITQDSRPP